MPDVIKVDPAKFEFDIGRDLSVTTREAIPGPPQRVDGLSVGFVTMDRSPPHNGEVHPDGDEILYVISGKVKVTWDSSPDSDLIVSTGEACIIPKGEWHKVHVIEKVTLMFITPGPNGDHRPLQTD